MNTLGKVSTLIILSSLAVSRSLGAPAMAVGDNAELLLTASANVSYDDNIYLRHTGVTRDTIWNFIPGVQFVFGQKAATNGQFSLQEDFLKYSSNSKQDANLANANFKSNYSDGKSKLNLSAGYQQLSQNDTSVPGAIVDRDLTNGGVTGEVALSDKTTVSLGALYDKTHYKLSSYSTWSDTSVPLDAYFEVSPKLEASLGYRYRDTSVTGPGSDSKDHFLNIGARGEFSPLLTGQVRIGYSTRSSAGAARQNLLGVQSNLDYSASQKTSLHLGIDNGFGNAANGSNTKNRSITLGAVNQFSDQWALNLNLTSLAVAYPTRTDNYLEGAVGASFVYNTHLNFTASYTYRQNGSVLSGNKFTNNVFNFGASIRY